MGRDDQSGKIGDTIKLSDKRTYLAEGSQIRNRFLDLRNELKLVSVCLHKSSAQRSPFVGIGQ